MNKVAQVTLFFWIMKICATTLGETAGDLLSMTMSVGYAALASFFSRLDRVASAPNLTRSKRSSR